MFSPAYLSVGTEVSAKYRGAFCEARIKKALKNVKCKVTLVNPPHHSFFITDEAIDGALNLNRRVNVKRPDSDEWLPAVINKIIDSSTYTVVFNDGDENTLRRSQLCLKGDKHFDKSETLDNLPLSHPEHFGIPVKGRDNTKRNFNDEYCDSDLTDESNEEKKSKRIITHKSTGMIGKVVFAEVGDRKKQSTPCLIVKPSSCEIPLRPKDQYLLKSFKDSRFYVIAKRETSEFKVEEAKFCEDKMMKACIDRAITYIDTNELPANWQKNILINDNQISECETCEDDFSNVDRDHFIAQLYKFNEERRTPIIKTPTLASKELDLFQLFRLVRKCGGYNKVVKDSKWKYVRTRMGLPSTNNTVSQLKIAYKRHLLSYEEIDKKLGLSSNDNRSGRTRGGRNSVTLNTTNITPEEKTNLSLELINDPVLKSEKNMTVPSDSLRIKRRLNQKDDVDPCRKRCIKDDLSPRVNVSREKCNKDESKRILTNKIKQDIVFDEARKQRPQRKRATISNKDDDECAKVDKRKRIDDKILVHENDDIKNIEIDESNIPKMDNDNLPDIIPINSRLLVRYGRGRTLKAYDAKVINTECEDNEVFYLVHYAGWNIRYDEWVGREKIVKMLEEGDGKCVAKNTRPFSSPRLKLSMDKTNNPIKKKPDMKIVSNSRPGPGRPSSSQNKGNRFTRSSSIENSQSLPIRSHQYRKTSSLADNDSQTSEIKSIDGSFPAETDSFTNDNQSMDDERISIKEEKSNNEDNTNELKDVHVNDNNISDQLQKPEKINEDQSLIFTSEKKPVIESPLKSPSRGRPKHITSKSPKTLQTRSRLRQNSIDEKNIVSNNEYMEKKEIENIKLEDNVLHETIDSDTSITIKQENQLALNSSDITSESIIPENKNELVTETKDSNFDENCEEIPKSLVQVDLICSEVNAVENVEKIDVENRLLESLNKETISKQEVNDNEIIVEKECNLKTMKKSKQTKKFRRPKSSFDEAKKKFPKEPNLKSFRTSGDDNGNNAFTPPYTPPDDDNKSKSPSSSSPRVEHCDDNINNSSPSSNGNLASSDSSNCVKGLPNENNESTIVKDQIRSNKKRKSRRHNIHNSESEDIVKPSSFTNQTHVSPTKSPGSTGNITVNSEQMEIILKKYNLTPDEGEDLEGEQKVLFLQRRMQEIRTIYMQLKSEVSCLNRRYKRAKKRDSSKESNANLNTSNNFEVIASTTLS